MISSLNRPSSSRYMWTVVGLLWPVALLNYLDRQMLAAMKFSVMSDIPSIGTDANWGYMLGQFKLVYAFLSPVGGLIADRYSRRLTICGSLFVWSAVTYATGYVTTYNGLLWTRTLMGISEAFYIPAALALIADFHHAGTRSRAVGIHQMAIYTGIIVGGFSGFVADAPSLGWRFAFDLTGLVGIIYAVPLLFLLKDVPAREPETEALRESSAATRDARQSVHSSLTNSQETSDPTGRQAALTISAFRSMTSLLTNGSFILLVLYFTLPAMAGWVVKDWMPAILKEKFDIGQGMAGVSATLYVNIASILGAVLGGVLADRWLKRSIRGRIYTSAIGMTLFIPALFGVGNSGSLMMAVSFLMLFGLGWGFFDCNNMPILSQIVRPDQRATGYGIMNLISISCGGFADWGFGELQDRNVPLQAIFGVFASIAMVSVVLVLLIRPRTE